LERQSSSLARRKKPVPAAKPSHNIAHQLIPTSNFKKRSTISPVRIASKRHV
jgi:hypothetical protein